MDDVKSAVSEIICCDEKIEKQLRNKKLRNILRFLIIGFLFGRNIDHEISELKRRRESAENWISTRFKEIDAINSQLEELRKNAVILGPIERKQLVSKIQMLVNELQILKNNRIETEQEYRIRLSECAKELILQEKESICKEISRIVLSNSYLEFRSKEQLINYLKICEANISFFEQSELIDLNFLSKAKKDLKANKEFAERYNHNFIEKRKIEYSHLFKTKEFSLDEEQKKAIITDDKHNLVVAAAGSGKTEVLATRIAYLINQKPRGIEPNRILAIAFQDKAREDIAERILKNFNITGINVKTFHTLGKSIVEKYRGRIFIHNEILKDAQKLTEIKKIYERKLQERAFYNLFLEYLRFFNSETVESSEKYENLAKKKEAKYISLNNTQVSSRAEKEIFDLFLSHKINGKKIRIEYEPSFGEFQPDFWLTDFDLYIEHWGINREGHTPDSFRVTSEQYKTKMEKEKELFEKEKKLFVETFAFEYYENDRGKFNEIVKKRVLEKLQEAYHQEFELSPMSYEELVEIAWSPFDDPTPQNINNFIKNAKVYGLTSERIKDKIRNGNWTPKQETFTRLALEVYRDYEQFLRESGKIDFEDMINKAIEALQQDSCLYYDVFDHILIDEYQDISSQRNKLIELLIGRNPKCKLFCVGDDWQSIMGFAGSNLNYFLNFKDYFPNPETTKIQTNYRSQSMIVDAGAALIANNGINQIQKNTHSKKGTGKKIVVVSSDHQGKKYETKYFEQIAQDCVNKISRLIEEGIAPNDILVLSRFISRAYVVDVFRKKANEKGISFPEKNERLKKNQIRLTSAHGSKGQQAKIVFVLNVIRDRYGFPCEIEDNSIFEPVRENYPKQDQRQEERRLFYVAMTRAKEELVIYTWDMFVSQFLKEIAPFIEWESLHYWSEIPHF
jgi:DNA helicase IV